MTIYDDDCQSQFLVGSFKGKRSSLVPLLITDAFYFIPRRCIHQECVYGKSHLKGGQCAFLEFLLLPKHVVANNRGSVVDGCVLSQYSPPYLDQQHLLLCAHEIYTCL